MQMNDYQEQAKRAAVYPKVGGNLEYATLGLVGEAGGVANKVKKIQRDRLLLNSELREAIADELGDVLWYISACANELGYTLDGIAELNLSKVERRLANGTLGGSGDTR